MSNVYIRSAVTHSTRRSAQDFESFSDLWTCYVRWLKTSASIKKRLNVLGLSGTKAKRGFSLSAPLSDLPSLSSLPIKRWEDDVGKATSWAIKLAPVSIAIIAMCISYMLAMTIVWSMEKEPPIRVINYSVTPARPGSTMLVLANVERDLSRDCSATYSRRLVDLNGIMRPIEPDTTMGDNAIRSMDKRTPGKLLFAVPIPWDMPPGPAHIVTPLKYTCNPWHYRYPITTALEFDAMVLRP